MDHPERTACLGIILTTTLFLSTGMTSAGPRASSTFDSGDDGWRLVSTLGYNGPVSWLSTGGNPGGFIYGQDPDTGAFGFAAPAKFLGDKSAAYGTNLTFDIAAYTQPQGATSWVGLSGAGHQFVCNYAVPGSPYPAWHSRGVTLHENSGWADVNTGLPPTHQQMLAMLANLNGLVIAAEFRGDLPDDVSGLDNVNMLPEPACLMLVALGGLVARWRRF